MTRMTGPDCAVMCNFINTYTHTPPWENQCEWHRMTSMTGPDCAVMCNLINTHAHTHTHTKVTYRMCGLHIGHFDGGQGPRDCLYRCSTGTDTSRRTTSSATIPGRNPALFAVLIPYTVHLLAVPTRKELPGYSCQRYSPRTRSLLWGGE